jgi:hypothetical protein
MNIVTGFVGGINDRKDRDLSKYLDWGKHLLAVEIPITCFIERSVFFQLDVAPLSIGSFSYQCQSGVLDGISKTYEYAVWRHVRFVFFEKHDLFLWPYQALASRFSVHTGNPEKDTLGYMMVQCQKTEWMCIARALDCDLSNSGRKEYIWIDFGIFHMFRGMVDRFQSSLYELRNRVEKRLLQKGENGIVRIAGCWEPNRYGPENIYRDIQWVFAGSVFGGGPTALAEFGVRMREKCFQVLRERNTLMWEINVWILIYREKGELFSWYKSDHNCIILDSY